MYKEIEIETALGRLVTLVIECSYNQPSFGGNYEGIDHEELGDDYSIEKIYLNDVDVTGRINRFCKKLFCKLEDKINESN